MQCVGETSLAAESMVQASHRYPQNVSTLTYVNDLSHIPLLGFWGRLGNTFNPCRFSFASRVDCIRCSSSEIMEIGWLREGVACSASWPESSSRKEELWWLFYEIKTQDFTNGINTKIMLSLYYETNINIILYWNTNVQKCCTNWGLWVISYTMQCNVIS